MNLTLRPARPSDATAVLPWICEASGPIVRHVFGLGVDEARARAFVAEAFAHPKGPFSHAHTAVALVDDRVAGLALAFPARAMWPINLAFTGLVLRRYRASELPVLLARSLEAEPLQRGVPDDCFYLSVLGVDPARRGLGVGHSLLADTYARGLREGCSRCALHVSVDNPRAQKLYAREGFTHLTTVGNPRAEARWGLHAQHVLVREPPR